MTPGAIGGSDREMALDAAAIALGSAALCTWSQHLALMTALMPALWVARLMAWRLLAGGGARPWSREAALLGVCTALGAFNDWNSVVNHRIYDYTVPVYFPEATTIPIWMLLFWGLILRFLLTLTRWRRLGPAAPSDRVRLGRRRIDHPALRVALLLLLVLVTRQAIYHWYLEPVLSWVPFLLAAVLYGLLFGISRHDLKVCAVLAVGGPAIEVLYIQVAGLHAYHLGWLGGVPLWIALWWILATLVWKDLGGRLQRRLGADRPDAPIPAAAAMPPDAATDARPGWAPR